MLLKRIIGCKETVNLVVVPCNVDIATTEALKMAQEVDPTGERTIGKMIFKVWAEKEVKSFFLPSMKSDVLCSAPNL